MGLLYEIAHGSSKNRGHFVKAENLDKVWQKLGNQMVYRSVYAYDETIKEFYDNKHSMKGFEGQRYIEEIVFDIDKKDNSDLYTKKKAIALLQFLEELGIEEDEIQIYFSGRAWHFHTSNYIWQFQPSKDLPYIVKESLRRVLEPLGKGFYDESIYMATGMFRLEHTLNDKEDSMLYKIPVSKNEFLCMEVDAIKELAKTPRTDFEKVDFNEILESQRGKLNHLVIKETEKKVELANYSKTVQKSNVAVCIHKLIEKGASDGNRNNSLLRIATHLRRQNLPEEFTVQGLLHYWNNKNNEGLEEAKIRDMVAKTYRSPYNYGCNDSLLKTMCRPECIFYNNKGYSQHILSTEDMSNELRNYISMDKTGKLIDLAFLLGEPEKEIIAEPGDFILIVGDTGTNKSTFKQHIMISQDFINGTIHYDKQIPFLSVELELTSAKVQRRLTQQICKVSKREALANYDKYAGIVEKATSNIITTREVRDVETLRQKIIEHNVSAIFIDYLQCFKRMDSQYKDPTFMENLPHKLRDLATELNVIIFGISQITKGDKANKSVTANSGKGSGDLSDAASFIITINGDRTDVYRSLKIEKATDGDTTPDGILLQFNKDQFMLERL